MDNEETLLYDLERDDINEKDVDEIDESNEDIWQPGDIRNERKIDIKTDNDEKNRNMIGKF